jgi:hypothetical protein
MKKILLTWLSFTIALYLSSQVVSTNPAIVIQQTGVSVTLTFDVSSITALSGNTDPLYVHTGVLTTASTDNGDWKNVIPLAGWPPKATTVDDGTYNIPSKNKLTNIGTNKWQLTISDINAYYGLTAGTIVKQMAFVVRNADGSKQSDNLYVDVYQPGLNALVTSPSHNGLVSFGNSSTISGFASNSDGSSCNLSLYAGLTSNNNILGSTPLVTNSGVGISASTTYSFPAVGDYYVIAKAISGSQTKYDTAWVCVMPSGTPASVARPTGVQEGLTFNSDGSVTFCFSLAFKGEVNAGTRVFLLGDFNNFRPSNAYLMNRQADGTSYGAGYPTYFYWITISNFNANTEYAYQYLVAGLNGDKYTTVNVGDPYCEKILDSNNDKYITSTVYPNLRNYPANASGVVSCFNYAPTSKYTYQYTSSYTPPSQNNLMIYEMLFRDFTTEGTVQAAIQKLDYLKALGINAVELMPIMEFDGNNSWGYNPNFYFAADKAYGVKADYQQFIDECHKRGIAVILDIVFNHTWGLSPYCLTYWDHTNNRPSSTNPYYNAVAPHPYSVGNDLNHSDPRVKKWLKRALAFWLTEYKVDGFRFDLSKGFTQTSSDANSVNNYDATRVANVQEYTDAIKATNSNAYAIFEHFVSSENSAITSHNNAMVWNNQNGGAAKQGAMGYYTSGCDFGLFINDGSGAVSPSGLVSYGESHDEVRLGRFQLAFGNYDLKTNLTNRMKELAVTAGFMYLTKGPRMMWEFGELGADYISKSGTDGTSGDNLTNPVAPLWSYLSDADRGGLEAKYAKILNFRKNYGDLITNPTTYIQNIDNSGWSTVGKRLYYENATMKCIVVGNFSNSSSPIYSNFPSTGRWYNYMAGDSIDVSSTSQTITLDPFELRIYTSKRIVTGTKTIYNDVARVYPNPVEDNLFVTGAQAVSIQISGLGGNTLLKRAMQDNSVSLQPLPAGIYVGRLTFDDGSVKIIKICKK